MTDLRVGIGVDAHALEAGVPLVLGGVSIDHPRGLAGHSDGDVVAHALIVAILGAAILGDIGSLFPSGDEQYRGASSLDLLWEAYREVREAGWEHVVVDAIADVGDLRCPAFHQLDDPGEERGLGLAHAQARRRRDDVGGKSRVTRPRLERFGLIPDDPGPQPELASPAEAVERVRVQILQRVRLLVPARRLGDSEMAPERRVLFPSGDRHAQRGPDDMRLQPAMICKPAPPALLVDERLADVEDDGLQSHDSTSARSAGVVTFISLRSPSTTATRPPDRSTSDAQSVAPPRSPENALRSTGARNACGV